MPADSHYVPALGIPFLTRFYDALMYGLSVERRLRAPLVARICAASPSSLLDLGCGTGTQLETLARALPECAFAGVDIDDTMLSRARRRLAGRKQVTLLHGDITALDLPDAAFDAAVSTLVFHHLQPEQKCASLEEARRVLRPGGKFWLYDWDRPASALSSLGFRIVERLDGYSNTCDHRAGRMPQFLKEAGFVGVTPLWRQGWGVGTMTCWEASNPGE